MATCGLSNPMISVTSNKMELINEAFVLFVTYHLYMFTDFLPNMEIRRIVGLSLIATTLLNVILSIGVVVVETLNLAARRLKIQFLKFK